MLAEIHEGLKKLVFEQGKLDPRDVDVEFETPSREWVGGLSRPTINFFLFDLQENLALRQITPEVTREGNHGSRRLPPRRFDLHYQVTAISGDTRDQHEILWRVMVTLLRHPQFPEGYVPAWARRPDVPLLARVGQPDDSPRLRELWTALGSGPRPALLYALTMPVDLELASSAPLVLTRTARYAPLPDGGRGWSEAPYRIGGQVLDRQGQPLEGVMVWREDSAAAGEVTDRDGHFVLAGVPPGELRLRVARVGQGPQRFVLQVPSDRYEIVL
jgi:hypothetical protein